MLTTTVTYNVYLWSECYSAFTLATSELCQTGVVLFLKVDSSTTTGTSQVLATRYSD